MKKNKTIFWITTLMIILFEGLMPLTIILFAPEYITIGTKPLGYPDYFAYTLIIFKILGVVTIAFPNLKWKIKEWAYAGLTFNLIFAFISHIMIDGVVFASFFPLIILLILAVSYLHQDKTQNY